MKEKKKIPWGLIYVGLTVVVMIVFGLVNTEFAGMFPSSQIFPSGLWRSPC